MSVSSLWKHLLLIITIPTVMAACAKEPVASRPTLVEVQRRGDDALTTKLRDALENAFESSPDFVLNIGKEPSELIVKIPDHVEWEDVGERTKVIYTVEFSVVGGEKISTIKGWCWDGEYENCTAKIMKAARKAARKIHHNERKSKQ